MYTNNGCITKTKTVPGKFKRLKYFHGMLLTEHDFQEEQIYYREKLRLHNRFFHGTGVVWGLSLKEKSDKDGIPTSEVTIEAGFAIDCEGNEIIVCKDYDVSLEEEIDLLEKQGECQEENSPKLYIGVQYCECESDPVQQYTVVCDDDKLHPQFSRVREGFCIRILREDEVPSCSASIKTVHKEDCDCKTIYPGKPCPGAGHCCADEHIIILGWVEISGEDIKAITSDEINTSKGFMSLPYNPNQHWENAKLALIERYCQVREWQNISIVLGKSYNEAKAILEEMGMTVEQRDVSNLSPEELERAKGALPCAPEGSTILLITDSEDCVLLAMGVAEEPGERKTKKS